MDLIVECRRNRSDLASLDSIILYYIMNSEVVHDYRCTKRLNTY